jgi:hypothetical protein
MLSNVVLPIFFLYFVLISGYCSSLLNCGLQRFMKNSIYFKHILIILSIYIFTFILNWYTFDSLAIGQQEGFENENENENENKGEPAEFNMDSLKKLAKWFLYTLAIYAIFLISTKSEVTYIIIFFGYTVLSILLQIFLKSISSSSYNVLTNKLFITNKDYKGANRNLVVYIHNTITTGFIISLLLLLFGFVHYFNRQYKDHYKTWDTKLFLFGTSHCKNL